MSNCIQFAGHRKVIFKNEDFRVGDFLTALGLVEPLAEEPKDYIGYHLWWFLADTCLPVPEGLEVTSGKDVQVIRIGISKEQLGY
jgi:hypothetical protein